MKKRKIERLSDIFRYYGARNQLMKCAEETAEFQAELIKCINGKGNVAAVTEELADLLITVEYVKMAYGITDEELELEQLLKIERQEQRML